MYIMIMHTFVICSSFPIQKRPLGRLEAQYDFRPRQPVLSSRTVDIDMSGTRTYRAKSTGDIIDEQHKLIHEVYSKARWGGIIH